MLPAPRVALAALPPAVAAFCSYDTFERALHSRGCSFVDQLRNLGGRFDDGRAVDLVAFPHHEAEVAALLAACAAGVGGKPVAVVPWGGGSSVSEGLGAPVDEAGRYAGCICVDLIHLNQLLSVDTKSLSVRVQAGMYGPALEAALRPHGLEEGVAGIPLVAIEATHTWAEWGVDHCRGEPDWGIAVGS